MHDLVLQPASQTWIGSSIWGGVYSNSNQLIDSIPFRSTYVQYFYYVSYRWSPIGIEILASGVAFHLCLKI